VQGPGNLAVAATIGSNVFYFFRDDVAPFAWHGPTTIIATGVTGNPSLVQATPGTYGTMGNFELVTPGRTAAAGPLRPGAAVASRGLAPAARRGLDRPEGERTCPDAAGPSRPGSAVRRLLDSAWLPGVSPSGPTQRHGLICLCSAHL